MSAENSKAIEFAQLMQEGKERPSLDFLHRFKTFMEENKAEFDSIVSDFVHLHHAGGLPLHGSNCEACSPEMKN